MLTKNDIKYAIRTLYLAGKRLPDGVGEDMLCKFWLDTFKDTDLSDWQNATLKASTMSSAGNVNVNVMTPALMTEAINLARQERIDRQRTEAKELDKPINPNLMKHRTSVMVWTWTNKKLKEKVTFGAILPTPEQVQEKLKELDFDNNMDNRILMKIYLADCNLYGDKMHYTTYRTEKGEIGFRGLRA